MKRLTCFLISLLMIAILGCAGSQLKLTEDPSSLQSVLKSLDKIPVDANGFHNLAIPDKTQKGACWVIFKNDKGSYGFGYVADDGNAFSMFMAEYQKFVLFQNGVPVAELSKADFEKFWAMTVQEIKKEGDLSKAGQFKPIEPKESRAPRPNKIPNGALKAVPI